jgi:hypothetical protein
VRWLVTCAVREPAQASPLIDSSRLPTSSAIDGDWAGFSDPDMVAPQRYSLSDSSPRMSGAVKRKRVPQIPFFRWQLLKGGNLERPGARHLVRHQPASQKPTVNGLPPVPQFPVYIKPISPTRRFVKVSLPWREPGAGKSVATCGTIRRSRRQSRRLDHQSRDGGGHDHHADDGPPSQGHSLPGVPYAARY